VPASAHTSETSQPSWRRIGRYELGPRLAAGGMAELYVARATGVHGFQKYFALKRILPRWADDREFVEMFLDEARLAAQLDHPNVVHVHDIGEDDDGPFFTMDYIHGQSLLALIRRQRTRGSFLPWDAFVALGSAAAAGLHHAHDRRGFDGRALGIIHRDVSPTNILVTYDGVVKIVDFGIAKASTSRHSTRPSVRKGKMAYMSPEQCRGDVLDRRSDVFALGVVLYELCTLARAFTGEGEFAVMNQIVNHDLPPARARRADVPAELDRILSRALHRDPDARYGSARELQRELDELAVDEGLVASPEALAVVMEELFGVSPYPWEGAAEPEPTEAGEEPREHDTDATESKPTTARPTAVTSVTSVKPEPLESGPRPVAPQASPARAWALGGLAAGVLAAIAWIAVPRGDVASSGAMQQGQSEDPPTAPATADAAAPSVANDSAEGSIPSSPAAEGSIAPSPSPPPPGSPSDASNAAGTSTALPPADPIEAPAPDAGAAASPSEQATPPPTDDPIASPKRGRRTGKPARPRATASATDEPLPAPFDPDAPAPRMR
jgi:serine/threonine protein kinase